MDSTASTADTLPQGSRLQNYRIVRLLGRGGFGVIYLATDVSLGHRVAIKEYLPSDIARRSDDNRVRPNHASDGTLYQWGLDRFVKEARNLVRFRHPNIVRVSALFQENNTAYMVMDFEEGLSLRQHVRTPQNRSERALKRLIEPIAQGLSEVHRQGFIHRDIKPGNLLVRKDASPVLLDFGSARLASRHATQGLTALVSSGYAPLEQYNPESEEQQGPWSDIYALGGVLYFCIAQKHPADSTQRSLAIVNGKADPLIAASIVGKDHYSAAFLSAIDWALSVRIADRPQMLGDWIPALYAIDVPPDASEATQLFFDQQTRLASTPTQRTTRSATPRGTTHSTQLDDESRTLLDDENWDRAVATAERHGTARMNKQQTLAATSYAAEARKRFRLGWLLSFIGFAVIATVLWVGYNHLISMMERQQADLSAQRLAADEALARAEQARQEAIAAIAEQRERQAEQIRLGAERLVSERDAERSRLDEQSKAAAAAESSDKDNTQAEAADAQALAEAKAEAEANIRAEVAAKAKAEREARAAAAKAAEEKAEQERVEREKRAAEAERKQAAQRNQQNSLLDQARAALTENDLGTARDALRQAQRIELSNAQIEQVEQAIDAGEANAREPISDDEFERIVGEFHQLKQAIERGDVRGIKRLTQNDGAQLELFVRLIDGFERLEVSITGIRARDADKSIVGNLRINRMIRSNGDRTTPSSSYQDRPIKSRRVNGIWSDIIW